MLYTLQKYVGFVAGFYFFIIDFKAYYLHSRLTVIALDIRGPEDVQSVETTEKQFARGSFVKRIGIELIIL
jgi:hypothetical protein